MAGESCDQWTGEHWRQTGDQDSTLLSHYYYNITLILHHLLCISYFNTKYMISIYYWPNMTVMEDVYPQAFLGFRLRVEKISTVGHLCCTIYPSDW